MLDIWFVMSGKRAFAIIIVLVILGEMIQKLFLPSLKLSSQKHLNFTRGLVQMNFPFCGLDLLVESEEPWKVKALTPSQKNMGYAPED